MVKVDHNGIGTTDEIDSDTATGIEVLSEPLLYAEYVSTPPLGYHHTPHTRTPTLVTVPLFFHLFIDGLSGSPWLPCPL